MTTFVTFLSWQLRQYLDIYNAHERDFVKITLHIVYV